MWSALTKVFSPTTSSHCLPSNITNPVTTPPHFPPFERKGADGQFEIVHVPSHYVTPHPLPLPTGFIVTDSTTSTPRNDLLHDILISIPSIHWPRLVDKDNQHSALQTILQLVKAPNIREIHKALVDAHNESSNPTTTTDRTRIYALLGLRIQTSQVDRNHTPPYKLCATYLAW